MNKKMYLNIGCGDKFHNDWINVDMDSKSPYVMKVNLLDGIPFPPDTFDVIYHSQVLEHFPKDKAGAFISECYRVLKPGGIIRVVVPDLENIINEYKTYLDENLNDPNDMSEANYDWIMLEMYDQAVRNYSGGQMAKYLQRKEIINERYVIERIGYVGRLIRGNYLNSLSATHSIKQTSIYSIIKSKIKNMAYRLKSAVFTRDQSEENAMAIGRFRMSGEVHFWMYDRYSLARLLRSCHFVDVEVLNPSKSNIPDWNSYELDIRNGIIYDPNSLFMEAKKNRP